MKSALPLLLLFAPYLCWAQSLDDLPGAGNQASIDQLTFSNTGRWASEPLSWLRKSPEYLPRNWRQSITIPEPPDNSSERTRAELKELVKLTNRRPAHEESIQRELELVNFEFGAYTYGELIGRKDLPKTGELIRTMYHSVACAIFAMKRQHNRPRPTVVAAKLGIALDSSIPNPGHPAYPSGHATGAYAIAYLLRELDPDHAERFLGDARAIARNREIAGVHYPSDSEAGRLLARQLVDAFLRDRKFQVRLESARKEWALRESKE